MTARQLDYIKSLASQKNLDGLTVEQLQFIGRVVGGQRDLTPAQASRVIDQLVALPNRDGQPVHSAATGRIPEVAAGRYALVDTAGVVKFYTVDRPTEGRWAGRTFVNAMGSDTRYPIRDREQRNAILAKIAEGPVRAMRLYAAELGRCAYCGRELTDETSRAAGIGPDCAARHDIDRSEWAEQAQREQAERLRSVYVDTTPGPGSDPRPSVAPSSDNFVDQQRELQAARPSVPVDGVEEDIYWGNEFGRVEAEQERTAYAAEMELEQAAEHRDPQPRRSDPSRAMGWQQRRAAVREQQGDTSRQSRPSSQLQELPSETWEDIFGMGAGA